MLLLLCQNAIGKETLGTYLNLQQPTKTITTRQIISPGDTALIKLKQNLQKRGIAFTDTLLYFKRIIDIKLKAQDTTSVYKLNEELKRQAVRLNSQYFLAEYYLYDGRLKKQQRKFGPALKSLFAGIELSEKFATNKELARFYVLLTNIFFELRDSKKLQFYSNKLHSLEKKHMQVHILSEIHKALPYVLSGKSDKALAMLNGFEQSPKMSMPIYAFSVYLYQSHAYYRLGKYEQSINRLALAEKLDSEAEKVIPNVSIHRKHGLILTLVALKNYPRAKQEFEKHIAQILKLMDWDDRREIFEAASKLYEALGDDKKALKYFRQYEVYKDSVTNLATRKLVNDIEVKYQTSLKEKAIANQKIQLVQKDNQLQKSERNINTIMGIMVLLILCAIIYYLFTKNKVQAIQLNQLKSQIHPHFLFNALNSLYSLTMSKSDDAPDVVIGISNILRYILYECNGPCVSLEKEMDVIREYVKLEKMRKKDNVDVNVNIAPNLNNYHIAPLLLLPLVENAYKHGVNKLIDDAWVNIDARVAGNNCIFKISNNKPVDSENAGDKTRYGNIGLQNIRKRLQILYPGKHKLDITQSEDVFIVSVEVAVNSK